jgi:5-methylcytosine-specific restriction endonuclease McrA
MVQEVDNSFENDDGEQRYFTSRVRQSRKNLYKRVLNICCMPGCESSAGLHVHHIVPIKHGGSDEYMNYIVLCRNCHYHSRLHSWGYDRRLEVLTFKFYREYLNLGFTSDDLSSEEFEIKLREIL